MTRTTNPRDYQDKPATQILFENLHELGTYHLDGRLIRVPEDALKPGRSPVIQICGIEPVLVTKLSTDPFLPITKARMIAADLDLTVDF